MGFITFYWVQSTLLTFPFDLVEVRICLTGTELAGLKPNIGKIKKKRREKLSCNPIRKTFSLFSSSDEAATRLISTPHPPSPPPPNK